MDEFWNKGSYEILEIYEQNFIKTFDLKTYMRIIHNEDDNIIKQITNSAIESCENYCGINLIPKKIKFSISNFNKDKVYLPLVPLSSLVELKVPSKDEELFDVEGLDLNHKEGIISFNENIQCKKLSITYMTGFEKPDLIPSSLIQGIMMHVAQIYDSGSSQAISIDLEKLYKSYRKIRI
jgi:uncharacterized phiE125 gp8 family phage protein